MMTITFPYRFDTATVWQKIVKAVIAGAALLLLLVIIALLLGKTTAAVQLVIVMAILAFIAWRVRAFPMGATGTLTEREVVVNSVSAFGLPLRVPHGRFPITDFQSVRYVERLVTTNTQGMERVGHVYLVGRDDVPDIEILTAQGSEAEAAARQLGALLYLDVITAAPAGVKWLNADVR